MKNNELLSWYQKPKAIIIFFALFSLFSFGNKSNNVDIKLSLKNTIEKQEKYIQKKNKINFNSHFNDNNTEINYLDVVKNHIRKTWDENEEVEKIFEQNGNLIIVGKDGGNVSTYLFSDAKILEGNLNEDDKEEHFIIVKETGGNTEWNDNFIVYDGATEEFDVKQIMGEVVNPPKNNDGCYFEIENIKNGFLYGTLHICKKRGQTKYDDIWEEIKTNCRIINNRLELMN